MAKNGNGGILFYLKVVAIAITIAAGAGALMRTYIVGPVADCAERAETKADKNAEAIGKLNERAAAIETNTNNTADDVKEIKSDLKTFMRKKGVRPSEDIDEGE